MFTARIFGPGLISLGLLSCLLCVEVSGAESRPASLDEIQTLFDLAAVKPQRLRVVADIVSTETPWSEEQIAAEMAHQNELSKDLAQLPEAIQRERINAIARSHSGVRILHVQEWYSGGHYRLDQTDEGMVSEQYLKDHPGTYRNTYVNIGDPAISPYQSFFVDHQLRDLQLSKTMAYSKNDLWRVLGLEGELGLPLMIALLDSKASQKERLVINPAKVERIHNGSDPNWHLEAIPENGQESRTRFILRGRCVLPEKSDGLSDVEVVCVVGRIGQRVVCMEALSTNHTAHNSFISKREAFDAQGFPRVWKRTTIKPASPPKQVDVTFKDVDLNPTFDDEQIFSPNFVTNYIVADVTSGQSVVLKKPSLPFQPVTQPRSVKSMVMLVLLCTFLIVPVILVFFARRIKRSKPGHDVGKR